MKEVLLVILGFVLARVPIWLDRKRHLKTHWAAIRAELELCRERAAALLNDAILSPLYRLPTVTYESSFSVLLSEGALSESEALSLGRFFCQVHDINRGLDNAAQKLDLNDLEALHREYDRNLLKVRRLVENRDDGESLYVLSLRIIDAKIQQSWWSY
ncbi:hypothetical protein [Thiobacillus thioparus]|jgi:hypothetical protein|uniref:hypothetical protein n=1 Tax=Thiobacillus thioparus TaxID=931 RepID=UPI000364ECBA|nr:hypothetical protein [Thiobacillus thioparus]